MQFYNIKHIVYNEEWESKFNELAQRCKDLNGWSEKDLLQFAVTNMPMYKVWLIYLEDLVIDLEQSKMQKSFLGKLFNKRAIKDGNSWIEFYYYEEDQRLLKMIKISPRFHSSKGYIKTAVNLL